jgi:hypothetical protein
MSKLLNYLKCTSSGQGPTANFCEHNNEILGSIKVGNFSAP